MDQVENYEQCAKAIFEYTEKIGKLLLEGREKHGFDNLSDSIKHISAHLKKMVRRTKK